jgi:hypothetical protein
MDLTTCSVCVVAGSAGGAVTGFYVSRKRRGRRSARGSSRLRTMRAWPGRTQEEEPHPDGPKRPGGSS